MERRVDGRRPIENGSHCGRRDGIKSPLEIRPAETESKVEVGEGGGLAR